jgi:hypothetical protein
MNEVLRVALVLGGGLVLSLYHGYRGFMFQSLRTDAPFANWSKRRKVILLSLPDGFTYFATSASGFVSFVLCWELWTRITDPSKIEVGTAALFGFLVVYGILGVTGKMPHLIDTGQLSPPNFSITPGDKRCQEPLVTRKGMTSRFGLDSLFRPRSRPRKEAHNNGS